MLATRPPSPRPPLDTLETFYAAFRALDAETMRNCYAEAARFDDPVFGLQGREAIGSMWAMLCDGIKARGRADWRLEFHGLAAIGRRGRAHWEARYRYRGGGARVHNVIEAEFGFDEHGLILAHHDRFDLWRWARQALGWKGALLGWTPWFSHQLRKQAAERLVAWQPRAQR